MKSDTLLERLSPLVSERFSYRKFKNDRFIFVLKNYEAQFRFKILNCGFSNSARLCKLGLNNSIFENILNAVLYVFASDDSNDYQVFDRYFSYPTTDAYCTARFSDIDLHKYQNDMYYYLYKNRCNIDEETIDIDDGVDYRYYSETLSGIKKLKFPDTFYDDCDYGIFFKDVNGNWSRIFE